jgi:nucleoside-diphosphate-sugar epimerase
MKILFIGGKRFLGNSLLNELLLYKQIQIYLVYRGSTKPKINTIYKKKIIFLNFDRNNFAGLKKKIYNINFDYIIDNNCYNLKSHKGLIKILKNKNFYYIFTSSIVSYLSFAKIKNENDIINRKKNTIHREINKKIAINKNRIENYILSQNKFKYCILRMHNIIGKNDHSLKTEFLKNININTMQKFKIKMNDKMQFAFLPDIIKAIKKIIYKKIIVNKIYNIANKSISLKEIITLQNKFKFKKNNFIFKEKEIIENIIVSNKKICNELNFKFSNNKQIFKSLKSI